MKILPLIKINFAALLMLFFLAFIAYRMFAESPTKYAWKKIKNKKVENAVIFLVRAFFVLLLISFIIFVNIPILKDTLLATKPITITGKVNDAGSLLGIFTFWFYQGFSIDNKTYHIVFYPKLIINGKVYSISYLPYSKHVVAIEE